jgi:hypothetical protein
MDDRKTLANEYKQRKITGGIYRVMNTHNTMYLLEHATEIQAKQNAFNFMVATSSCFHFKLKEDWALFGGEAFTFEILERLEKKKEQSAEEFVDDLKILEQFWSEKFDPKMRY